MKQRDIQFGFGWIASFLLLFMIGCGGGGSSSDDDGNGSENGIPIADAGENFLATRNFNVSLDGTASSDPEGDALTYTWTQTLGPDVTNGIGTLSGATPSFQAPSEVSTLIFELVVNDGENDSASDLVGINVLENENAGFFVDGDTGSDETGTGSVEMPFASIAAALCAVNQDQQDIYVKTLADGAVYDETLDPCPGEPARDASQILTIPTGTSLYGGYDAEGIRDAFNHPTLVSTTHHGIIFNDVDFDAWFSGFNVRSNDSPDPGNSVYALSVLGGDAHMYIEDSQLIAGDVAFGSAANPGSSYGLRVALLEQATIQRNVISAGFGGDGLDIGNVFNQAAERGQDGGHDGVRSGGDGRGPEDYDGGSGGSGGGVAAFGIGGYGSSGGDGEGPNGGAGGSRGGCLGCGGASGASVEVSGNNGAIGMGGAGSAAMEVYEDGGFFVSFMNGSGNDGAPGESGSAGGGGGGGRGNLVYSGGAGGGGGGGGAGGAGGPGGPSGGVSVGLFIATVNTALVDSNEIFSGPGGIGATGGQGQIGGDGGSGRAGNVASAGNGGAGGDGGKGGDGGRGGAGGGGPSYGIAVGSDTEPTITNNTIGSSSGGNGGFGGVGGNGGDGGDSYAVYDTDLNDGVVPFLSNNDSSFSTVGEGGGTTGEGGNAGAIGSSGVRNW